MHRNIEDAFNLYSGERPYGIFVSKLGDNLKKMNSIYEDIKLLFGCSGVINFEKLPDDLAARGKFAKLFKEFNVHLESAFIQGFAWNELEYEIENNNGKSEKIKVNINETAYLSLALRYKELFSPADDSSKGFKEDLPYEIDTHLTEINTGAIDHKYMESRFRKYLKELQEGVEATRALKELRKSFAVLTQEQQKYAKIFLADVQQGNVLVEDNKTLVDYINKYQADARNDKIHRFASAIGIDENLLRDFMNQNITKENINEYGRFNKLADSVDKSVAKTYIEEKEGKPVRPYLIRQKICKYLEDFILPKSFE